MSKSSKITASELVLSAIFFLQKKNGVTAKDITKFICEKRGCRQSHVRSEVKRALERATENGIFSKKRGLYRIESGFGKNKISIKVRGTPRNKKMKKIKHSNSVRATEEDAYVKAALDAPMFAPTFAVPSFSRKRSLSKHTCPGTYMLSDGLEGKGSVKKILMEPTKCTKNAYDDDDDEDEDFFEEDDDEDDIDYFADDQFPTAADAVKEYPPSDPEPEKEEKKSVAAKRKMQSRSKSRTKGKSKKRKLSKPKKKAGKRKRNVVMRKSQKKNRGTEASDEELKQEDVENDYGPEGEDDENLELDSQGEDNDYGDDDEYVQNDDPQEPSDYENDDDNEHNHEDYESGDDDYPSDEEYVKKTKDAPKEGKGDENGDGAPKREEEGDQKEKKQPNTNIKLNQTAKENKVNSESSPTTPTPAAPPDAANQDKKSKPIRSSSLFSSFKKKNESKNSAVDRKQVKSRM